MNHLKITQLAGREILDSRGNPTVEAEVTLADGTGGRGGAPSGAATGAFEALELRDGDKARYGGKGAARAAGNIGAALADAVVGLNAADLCGVDAAMIAADVSTKAAAVEIGFVDRFNGSLVITGDVAAVEAALHSVMQGLGDLMGYSPAPMPKT